MKEITRNKARTVRADNAEEFDRLFNKASAELPSSAELVWDPSPMCVHFIYTDTEKIPETVKDEYELKGITYCCRNCPYLEKDEDRRKRRHACKYAVYGEVFEDEPACERFYRELNAGLLKPEE